VPIQLFIAGFLNFNSAILTEGSILRPIMR